jgi:hemolysin III
MATRKVEYTLGEEIANSITHGIGAALGVAALVVLVTFAGIQGDAWKVVSFSVYGATLVLLYLASTFYHSFRSSRVKRVFRIFDHASIYLLIAGTYTPFALVSLRGGWGWTIFGLIWGLAVCGVVLKSLALGKFRALTMILYVAMGWLILVALKPLFAALPAMGFAWLLVGGLCYTGGLVFFALKQRYAHAVWHLFVLAGSICHFFCILLYTLPT